MQAKRIFAGFFAAVFLVSSAFSAAAVQTVLQKSTDDVSLLSEGYVYIPDRSVYFADVDESLSWAFMEIDYLANSKVISGTGDCRFSPRAALKRADFVLMLYQAYGMSAYIGSDNFPDVPAGAYYAKAVSAARNLGIVYGDANGKFNPTQALTRQDAMVMLRRTLDKTGMKFQAGNLTAFRDASSVASYARADVGALVEAKVISGANGVLSPKASVNRAEMAIMLYRAIRLEDTANGQAYVDQDNVVNLCVGSTIYSHVTIKNVAVATRYHGLYECTDLRETAQGYEITLGNARELDQEIAWKDGALLVNGSSISVAEGCEAICIEPYGVIEEGIPATGGTYKAAAVSLVNGLASTIYYMQ